MQEQMHKIFFCQSKIIETYTRDVQKQMHKILFLKK